MDRQPALTPAGNCQRALTLGDDPERPIEDALMKCVKILGTDDRGFQIVYGYMALNAAGVAVASTARLQAMIDKDPRVTVVTPGKGRKVFLPADGMAYLEALQHEYYGSRLSATPVIDAPVEIFLNRLNEACEPDEAVKVMVVDEAATVVLPIAQYHAEGWAFIGVWPGGYSVVEGECGASTATTSSPGLRRWTRTSATREYSRRRKADDC